MYHIFYGCNSLENIDVSNFILYKLQNEIIDLFGDLRQNLYFEEIYNKLIKIKTEENIIKDIDSNIVMEIIFSRQHSLHTYIFGEKFNDSQISDSKMFVDDEEIKFTKYLNLSYGKDHVIKILLEGSLENASYMFSDCSYMKIKFYKNTNETKRRIFDK